MRHDGGLLVALGSGLGLIVAIYNFFAPVGLLAPESATAGTPGAGLMIFSTAVLLATGLVLAGGASNRALIGFLVVGSLIGILGTGLAAYLLDSMLLAALMLMSLVGWIMRIFTKRDALA